MSVYLEPQMWLTLLRNARSPSSGLPPRRWYQLAMIALWAVLFFLMTSPFTFVLTGTDPVVAAARDMTTNRREEGSQLLLYGLRYAVLAVAIFFALQRYRKASRDLRRLGPALLYFLWAAATVAWTDSVDSTLHGLMALLPLLLIGWFAIVRMQPADCALALLMSGVVMALASIAWVMVMPMQGVHSHSDASQGVHAGAWRGVYLHKNHLGQAAAIYAAGWAVAGRWVIRSRLLRLGFFALMVGIVIGSQSASAIAIIPIAVVLAFMIICLNPLQKAFAFLYALAVGIIASISLNLLLAMLGRDMTLSGRTTIWQIASDFILAHPLHGYGYMSTSYGGFSYAVSHVVNVLDPHNAYIDTLLSMGFIGLACFAIFIGRAFINARRLFVAGGPLAQGATVFGATLSAWLLSCLTESNSRPFGAAAALGLMSASILLTAHAYRAAGDPGQDEEWNYDGAPLRDTRLASESFGLNTDFLTDAADTDNADGFWAKLRRNWPRG